jgi:DNA-binding response OmpR family regulator
LRKRGFEVKTASDGNLAISVVENWTPDIIVADILMPEQNGIDMCHELKNNSSTKNIPVIFLSASSDDYHALAAMDAGGVNYISKPIRIDALCGIIEKELAVLK